MKPCEAVTFPPVDHAHQMRELRPRVAGTVEGAPSEELPVKSALQRDYCKQGGFRHGAGRARQNPPKIS
jgi:hypothetical protein